METIRAQLGPRLAGRSISDGGSHPSAKFADAVEAVGSQIGPVRRRGKYLIIGLDTADGAGSAADDPRSVAHGTQPDGTRTHGIPAHDTQPDGTQSHDIPAHESRADGTRAHGIPAHESRADGTRAHGIPAHGIPAHGTQPDGTQSHGPPTPGTHAHGSDTAEVASELVVHLGMTGRLAVNDDTDFGHPHLRAWWRLDDGAVFTFHDVRRFGRVHVVAAGCYENIATLDRLGPEPFSEQFTGLSLWQAVRSSRRCIKTQLLSQRPVAGVGNIYADEALWLAQINPAVRYVSKPRAGRLAEAIRTALASGLRHGGTTLRDYAALDGEQGRNQHHLHCYGRAGEPCERCGAELRRRVIDARGTTWCPDCQQR